MTDDFRSWLMAGISFWFSSPLALCVSAVLLPPLCPASLGREAAEAQQKHSRCTAETQGTPSRNMFFRRGHGLSATNCFLRSYHTTAPIWPQSTPLPLLEPRGHGSPLRSRQKPSLRNEGHHLGLPQNRRTRNRPNTIARLWETTIRSLPRSRRW